MAHLLMHWLNHELQLSTVVTDIDRDFASGYLLGEVLWQLNHQHNFSDFMNSSIADAKIVNFCLLEPSLRSMGVPLDATTATAIMNGTKGAAASFLYQIKMAATRLARAPGVSTKSLERKAVLPLPNMPTKLAKPTHDAGNHAFFEHSIRRHVKSLAALKREQEAIEDEVRKKQAHLRRQAAIAEDLEATKAERLHRAFIHSHYIKEALEESNSPAWRVAIATKHAREQRKAQFYQQLLAHRTKQHDEHLFSLRQTVKHDLDDFESRQTPPTLSSKDSQRTTRKSTGYGLRSLSVTLEKAQNATSAPRPCSEELSDRRETMARDTRAIHDQTQRREQRKQQLTRRRKRFVHECEHYHAHLSAVRTTVALDALVTRVTHCEHDVQRDMNNVLAYKDIARENRAVRRAAYVTQQRVDADAAIECDASRYGTLVLQFDDDSETQLQQQHLLCSAQDAATQHAHELLASNLVRDVLEFALVVAGAREQTLFARSPDVFLPEEQTWTEYKVLFAHDRPLLPASSAACSPLDAELLSEHALREYLASFLPFASDAASESVYTTTDTGTALSPWCPRTAKFIGAVDELPARITLGELVKYVRWMRAAEALSLSPSSVESGDASASDIVSDPSTEDVASSEPSGAGVSAAASDELQSTDDASLTQHGNDDAVAAAATESDDIANEQLTASEAATDGTIDKSKLLRILVFGSPFAGKKTQAARLAARYNLALLSAHELLTDALRTQSEVGVAAQELLQRGSELSPHIYSRLVLDAVRVLEDTVSADTPAPANDGSNEGQPVRGWIVYDLPGTEAQARDLEEQLTGFVDPERVPSPFDHESQVAPGCVKTPLPPTFLHGKSGVDLVFVLTCSSETAIERCLGQLEDAATHEAFHIVSNAPRSDSTERHRLAHANTSLTCSELISMQCVTDAAAAPTRWCEQFATLREVSTTHADADETHARMAEYVGAFFQRERDAAQRALEDREAAECVTMAAEEQTQLQVLALELAISNAREEHARRQLAVQQAEEAKAKKEELTEHRQALDAAQKLVDAAIRTAQDAAAEQHVLALQAREVYSGALTPALSAALATVWDAMEHEYVAMMTQSFALQREQRRRTMARASNVVDAFCAFTRRPSVAPRVVAAFQTRFNAVVDEMRFDDSTKCELHARTDVLQDELTLLVDTRAAENDDELRRVLADGWLEDTSQCVAVAFQAALQSECDRFVVSFQLLVDSYAAAAPTVLAPVAAHVRANQTILDVSSRLFFDASVVVVEESPAPMSAASVAPAPAATGKGAAKGKGKAAAPAPAAAAAAAAAAKDADPMKDGGGSGDSLSPEDLLAAYDRALHKCEAIAQLVTFKLATVGTTTANSIGTAGTPSALLLHTDVCAMNLLRGVQYEHELLQLRVQSLREAAQRACEHVTRAMRRVELTLRDVVQERREREHAAVAALVQHVRAAIEAEVDLPHYLNAKPELLYRFPITVQLREDTLVDVDPLRRLVPPSPVDPPPVVEPAYHVRLNPRQCAELAALLGLATSSARVLLPLTTVVDALHRASSTLLLPRAWRGCAPHTLAKIASKFLATDASGAATGLVDASALLAALGEDSAFVADALAVDSSIAVSRQDTSAVAIDQGEDSSQVEQEH